MLRLPALLLAFVQYAALSIAATVTVNVGTTYQTMDGFGFSEAFGYAEGIVALSGAAQKQCLDYLFNTTNGAGLTILRNRIGSGGSGDSIEPNSPGSPSATPKYTWDGSDSGQVFVSQQALKYGVTTIYADAWSAPGFMKTNDNQDNGGYLCGVSGETCSSGDWRQAYANFIVQYIKYYQQVGVTISHVGFLNEPEYAPSYSSMLSDGTQAADFIKILYPTIKSAGLSTKITCCDAEGWNDQKTFTAQLIAAGVESELGVITSHSYTSSPTSPISTSLRVWQTEYADLDDAFTTTWYSNGGPAEGLTWAQHIHTAIVNANVSGYLHWVGAQTNVNSAALVDIVGTTITPSGRLWAFAMFSRFVRPGAVRVSATTSTTGLLTSAYKNTGGTVAVVIINTGSSAQTATIAVSGYTAASAQGYVTSNSNTVSSQAATLSGGQVSTSVPAYSVVTVVLSGSGGSSTTTIGTTTTGTTTTGSTTTSSSPTGCTAALYDQCGGQGFTGCTTCASGSTCTYSNPYYSQCLA